MNKIKTLNGLLLIVLILGLFLAIYGLVRFVASLPHYTDGNDEISKVRLTANFYYDKSDSSILLYDRENDFFQYFIKNGIDSFKVEKESIIVFKKGNQIKIDTLHNTIQKF